MAITLAGLSVLVPSQISPTLSQLPDFTYSVSIIDYAFQPLHVNITTGTMVVWGYAENGTTIHTVTSIPGTNQTQTGTPLLDSGSLNPGQSYNYTFYQPGFYPFQCAVHPTLPAMNGWLAVTGPPLTPPSSQNSANLPLLVIAGIAAAIVGSLFFVWAFKRRTKEHHLTKT